MSQGETIVKGSVGMDLYNVLDAFYFVPEKGFEITRLVNSTFDVTPTKPGSHSHRFPKIVYHLRGSELLNND